MSYTCRYLGSGTKSAGPCLTPMFEAWGLHGVSGRQRTQQRTQSIRWGRGFGLSPLCIARIETRHRSSETLATQHPLDASCRPCPTPSHA